MSEYNGITFKTNLEATWAAFFDLAEWEWKVNVSAVDDFAADFWVSIPCGHSECSGSHDLLVSILPINDLKGIQGHPALKLMYNSKLQYADNGAVFGNNPYATQFEVMHGAGGGIYSVVDWIDFDVSSVWKIAVARVIAKARIDG